MISKSISGVGEAGGSGEGKGGEDIAAGGRGALSRLLALSSCNVGIAGVGDFSCGGCSADCTGPVTGGGDGVWLPRIIWAGGVIARCEEACPTSSVLPLGSGEGKIRGCALGAIFDLDIESPPPDLGFDGRPGILEAGRLNAAALIRPPRVSGGSPAVGLPLAGVRFGFLTLSVLLTVGVGSAEVGEPESGENWLAGEMVLDGDNP